MALVVMLGTAMISYERSNRHQHEKNTCEAAAAAAAAATDSLQAPSASTTDPQRNMSRIELRRSQTLRLMEDSTAKLSLGDRYAVDWANPLGEGSFGSVYRAKDKRTGELVAVKKISKKHCTEEDFYLEMNALLHLQKAGGHPGLCSLHEHFSEGGYYYLVLDLISGGELFDALVSRGAYSEYEASRLVREVATALQFMHGLGFTHGDLKVCVVFFLSRHRVCLCVG